MGATTAFFARSGAGLPSYVSPSAEWLLGYAAQRWVREPAFWTETVVHPEDRDDAVAYCALATGKKADHEFEYRAIRADGRVVWLLDVVRVVLGKRGVPERLRGLKFDVSQERSAATARPSGLYFRPTLAELRNVSA